MKIITQRSILTTLLLLLIVQYSFAQNVSVWLTNGDQSQKLQQQSDLTFNSTNGSQSVALWLNENTTYQEMDGFGAAMTGSSAYLINRELSYNQRENLMNDLFTESGIRLSFVRHAIGASDFDLYSFTYNDMAAGQSDPNLNNFSIDPDRADLIPMLQLAKQKNSDLKLIGTPWSAPAWMKEVHNLNGGWLNTFYYQAYANYLVKYAQQYAWEGLPIYAITLQNEPLHETGSYPSMRMDAGNQISFLKNNLGPAFANSGLSTKLLIYDHNWDHPEYPIEVMNDPTAKGYTAGTAFHAYAGTPDAQTTVHNAHPDKGIWFTEISGGDWATDFGGNLRWNMSNIVIGATRNWAKSVLLWNLALDQNDGPQNGGCTNCRGVVTIDNNSGNVTREVEYYVLGHISKFVDPGAVRIESNTFQGGIENVAFRNPDGSKVLIALNNGNSTQTFSINWDGKSADYTLDAGSVATFTWNNASTPPPSSGAPIGQTIWLRGSNGQYVSSENGWSPMMCNRSTADGWEHFTVVDGGNGLVTLQASNGQFVSSENGQSAMICNRSIADDWEKFEWIDLGNNQVALKGYNGKYVSSENGWSPMMCNRDAISGWETFTYGVNNNFRMAQAESTTMHSDQLQVNMYPNPINKNQQQLTLELSHVPAKPLQIQLMNMLGKVIQQQQETSLSREVQVTLSEKLSKGVYVLQVNSGQQSILKKLVIE